MRLIIYLVSAFFSFINKTLSFVRSVISNLLFIALLVFLYYVAVDETDEQTVSIDSNTLLELKLSGEVTEEKKTPTAMELLSNKNDHNIQQIDLFDIVKVIRTAKEDDNIVAILLHVNNLQITDGALEVVGKALTEFKASGKKIIAQNGYYDNVSYYLASFADVIQMNKEGHVLLSSKSAKRMYYKDLLDKLDVNVHVFKVGKFKSFVEPYIRNDMSDEAKEAYLEVITAIWQEYKQTILKNRENVAEALFDWGYTELNAALKASDYDTAKFALSNHLVDDLMTDVEMKNYLLMQFAKKTQSDKLNSISFNTYLSSLSGTGELFTQKKSAKDQVGLIFAHGTILEGNQPTGMIGGVSTSKLLEKARRDDNIKSVVLRVDSGGGSVFASEQIRQEVLALQAEGKPVVISMGSAAASGGYWISMNADYIYAQPNTITGSIGVFGLLSTFEKTLDKIGVHVDGVSVTEVTHQNVLEDIDPTYAVILQNGVEKIYDEFISLVASSRGLDKEFVDNIAQGRIWLGRKALELGLVDEVGFLDDAIVKSAQLANLGKNYSVKMVKKTLSAKEELLVHFFDNVYMRNIFSSIPFLSEWIYLQKRMTPFEMLFSLENPMDSYILCLDCQI